MIHIRMMNAMDAKDIYKLNQQLGYEYEEIKVYERILSLLESGNDILLVAEVNGSVIGFAHGAPYETLYADRLLNVIAFIVNDSHKDEMAAAEQLYNELEEQSKQFGYAGIRLVADQTRKKAEHFFYHHDYTSHRDLKHYIKLF